MISFCFHLSLALNRIMTDSTTTTQTNEKKRKGRPHKAETGKTLFIPAHLVKYVKALINADKDDNEHKLEP